MSVDLYPAELAFKRPFTHEVSQILRLHNPNTAPVAFKVKTTAPKQYCVRPNSGRIDPGGDVEVQVLLQAMREDPPVDAKCRDKFLVQSVAIAGQSEDSNITQIWANIEQTAKGSIQERKIRVSWLGSEGSAATGNAATNGLAAHDDEPPAYSSPGPIPVTPQRQPNLEQSRSSATNETPSTLQAAAASVSNATGISQDDLKRQLDEAKATISRLQQQAAEATGLRQRNTGTDTKVRDKDATGKTTLQTAPPAGGVPVQIVAVLCLIFFLIAYLFF